MITVGSLCSGYGGIELGLSQLTPVRLVWCADNDAAAVKLLAHHYPDVPNYGDLTSVDWATVPHVDAVTAGWPCQPWSLAGKQKGAGDARAIWPAIATAIRAVRPGYVFLENVPAIAGFGELARACGDLAQAGYLGAWDCLRAADVGAPHRRTRLFIAARTDPRGETSAVRDRPRGVEPDGEPGDRPGLGDGAIADTDGTGGTRRRRQRDVPGGSSATIRGRSTKPGRRGSATPADPGSPGRQGGVSATGPGPRGRDTGATDRDTAPQCGDRSATDPEGQRRGEGWSESARVQRGPDASERGGANCEHCTHSIVFHDGDGFCIHCPAGCYWGQAVADPDGEPVRAQPLTLAGGGGPTEPDTHGQAVADSHGDGRKRGSERHDEPVEPELETPLGRDADGRLLDWAGYGPAIARWESQLGRSAPNPTLVGRRGGLQLNPAFVEWLMGLPAGHVTDVPGLTRNQKLRLLGNGVVPAQAAAAYESLLLTLELEVAA